MPKRIIKNMRLSKIDMVDKPAQEPAKAAIIKRNEGGAMSPEDIAEIKKMMNEVIDARMEKSEEEVKAEAKEDEELAKAFSDTEAILLEQLEDDQADIYKSLSDEDKADMLVAFAEDPDGFLESLDEQTDEIRKAAEAEAGGDIDLNALSTEDKAAMFDEMLAGAETEEAAEQVTKGVDNELLKRDKRIEQLEAHLGFAQAVEKAKEKYPSLTGTDEEKAALLTAIDELPENQQELIHKMLKEGDTAIAEYQEEVGEGLSAEDGEMVKAIDHLAKRAAEIQKDRGVQYSEAYRLAAVEKKGRDLIAKAKESTEGYALGAGEAV